MSDFKRTLDGKVLIGMVHLRRWERHAMSCRSMRSNESRLMKRCCSPMQDSMPLSSRTCDLPYLNRQVGPEIVSAMTRISTVIRSAWNAPWIQVLAGNQAALAIAAAASSISSELRHSSMPMSPTRDS